MHAPFIRVREIIARIAGANMDRKEFLLTVGGAALAPFIPASLNVARAAESAVAATCRFSPSVPEGPFYFDAKLIRRDITEGRPGIPIEYQLSVVDAACQPVRDAKLDIWQCDNGGVYSGYPGQATGASTVGMTFLRGVQSTDAEGLAKFVAIYPGWYPGRLTHLHVKIHLPARGVVTTNLFFPDAVNAEVYASSAYKAHGPNPATVAQDVELKGDTARFNALTLRLTRGSGGSYMGAYKFAIAA
jgi:protocatechuate 3,4-dioxygenase beta subunit